MNTTYYTSLCACRFQKEASVIRYRYNCWRTQLALSAMQVLTFHRETLLNNILIKVQKWFPSVRFLSSCFCICNLYLTPKPWRHLLTREEPWNQSFDKDMECLWSLARLLAKEKTDMNTHQKIASINMQLDSTPRWPAWPHSLWHFGSYIKISGNRKCSEAQYKG